jgi:erythromycin esterase
MGRGRTVCERPLVEIEVAVQDPDGRPATEGVTVAAIPRHSSIASDVSYGISMPAKLCLAKGEYAFTATTASLAPAFNTTVRVVGPMSTKLSLGARAPVIRGRVAGLSSTPAYVRIVRASDEVGDVFYARVAADGAFSAGLLPNFDYRVDLERGYTSPAARVELASTDVEISIAALAETMLRQPADESLLASLSKQAIALRTTTPVGDIGDMRPFVAALKDARVVGIGENSHGAREHQEMRQRVLRGLAELDGFRLLILEAGFAEIAQLNRYVSAGEGLPEDALDSLRMWIWNDYETLAALVWLRKFNASRPASERIQLYGMDIQDADNARRFVLDYLRKVDVSEALRFERETSSLQWPNARGFSRLGVAEQKKVLQVTRELAGLFDSKRSAYVANGGGDEAWGMARQHAVVLAQAVDYYMAGSDPRGLRDKFMADNVAWVLERGGEGSRAVLWAHNAHIAKNGQGWPRPAGSYLREKLGDGYVSIGQLFASGTFRAWDFTYENDADSSVQPILLPPLDASFFEGTLGRLASRVFAIDLRRASGTLLDWASKPRRFVSIGSEFHDLGNCSDVNSLSNMFDVVLFTNAVTATYPREKAFRGPHSR